MANPHPTPRLENLRQPWQPGTSGNPAGYSQGRRISDAIQGLIDGLGLQREFGTAAIAMALGKKHLLKQKVTDPETGKDVWVEQQPDLAWFKQPGTSGSGPDWQAGSAGAGGDRRRGLLAALSPGRRPR